MKYGFFTFALVLILTAASVSAFEGETGECHERRLLIDLEPHPSQVQKEFDRYVQDLAEAARKDATPEARARKEDAAEKQQLKVLNPIALLRW